jgi:hypothetical protein
MRNSASLDLAALNAELDRLEAKTQEQLQRQPGSDPQFRFEDGVLSAVAAIRRKFGQASPRDSVSAEAAEAYSKFHREWGEAVGTSGYDKEAWKAKQIELFGKKGRP